MRRRWLHHCALAAALVAAAGPGTAAPETDAEAAPLAARLEAALAHPALQGSRVGALVVRAEDGATLFARAPDRALTPASNLKILTALAALETFGPTHRFATRVLADRPPDAEGAVGVLYLEGGGDPALTSEQWWRLAADLHRGGLRRVAEALVLDDGALDGQRWHGGWGQVGSRAYHAPVGGLAANYGAFAVEVGPGRAPGAPARVTLDPPAPYLRVAARARTGAPGSATRLAVDRTATGGGFERIAVTGTIAADAEPHTYWRSVADPTLYAGAVARMQLEAVGIRVEGPTRVGRAPEDAGELLAFEGHSLGRVVALFVKYSNNAVAETLFKQLGRTSSGAPGSWDSGREAVLASLRRLGIATPGLRIVDGSGLARANRVAPRTLVEALRRARASFAFGPELVAALPIAARDGTLEKRAGAAADAVRAKTGLLDRVTGLSGLARHPEQGILVFSVLVNGYRASDEAAMTAVDGFAAALTRASEPVARLPIAGGPE